MPLNFNTTLLELEDSNEQNLKSGVQLKKIYVDLDSSKLILVDDFSYNSHRPYTNYWQDKSVYINRNFAINPVTVGVATFDGMDEFGYPYNFITPTSYGACDTLTSLPIELNEVNRSTDDPVYLSFSFQPQGISPFSPSDEDSIILELFQPYRFDTTKTNVGGVIVITVDSTRIDRWTRYWGRSGYSLNSSNAQCNNAFQSQTIKIPPYMYQDSFQFRFVSYGNTSGNVDQWHVDFIVLSSDADGHNKLGDYAFIMGLDTISMIKEYRSMPWFHYRGNESRYTRSRKLEYFMRNSYGQQAAVDLEYFAYDPNGKVVDSIVNSGSAGNVPLNPKSCRREDLPLVGDPNHDFIFKNDAIPINSTTHFLTQSIMRIQSTGPGNLDLIELNNQVDQYQIFGTYYAYDDGSAEAGYGVKADDGKLAVQFIMPPGITDTLTSIYMHFNPVIVDRSKQRFRLTVWGDDGEGFPGDILYENASISTPIYYGKDQYGTVNYYHKLWLDQSVMVSDTFYVGYQKINEDVINIGYDLNNKSNDKIFVSLGGPWQKGVGVTTKGSVMMRPSFRNLQEPIVGVKEKKVEVDVSLNLYPNPTENILNYSLKGDGFSRWYGRVVNMEGRLLHSFQADYQGYIDVSTMPSGLYIFLLQNEGSGESITKKFLIKR